VGMLVFWWIRKSLGRGSGFDGVATVMGGRSWTAQRAEIFHEPRRMIASGGTSMLPRSLLEIES
jgi:hypothetical protein